MQRTSSGPHGRWTCTAGGRSDSKRAARHESMLHSGAMNVQAGQAVRQGGRARAQQQRLPQRVPSRCSGHAASARQSSPVALPAQRRRGAQLVASVGSVEPVPVAEATAGNTLAPAAIWEVDFCSRPLLDDRGKKVWELLITDADRKLQYSEFFPNNKINSQEVRRRPVEAIPWL